MLFLSMFAEWCMQYYIDFGLLWGSPLGYAVSKHSFGELEGIENMMKSLAFIIITSFFLIPACNTEEGIPGRIVQEESSTEEISTITATDAETEQRADIQYTLRSRGAGLFEIGSTREEIEQAALAYDNVEIETTELPPGWQAATTVELTFGDSGKISFEFYENDPSSFRAVVSTNLFSTEEGIYTGSTYDDLLNAYSFNSAIWNSEGYAVVVITEKRITFKIDHNEETIDEDFVLQVPGDARVTEISLW